MIKIAMCSFCGKKFNNRDYGKDYEKKCLNHEQVKHSIILKTREEYFQRVIELYNEKYKYNDLVCKIESSTSSFLISTNLTTLTMSCWFSVKNDPFNYKHNITITYDYKSLYLNKGEEENILTLDLGIRAIERELLNDIYVIPSSTAQAHLPVTIPILDLMLNEIEK